MTLVETTIKLFCLLLTSFNERDHDEGGWERNRERSEVKFKRDNRCQKQEQQKQKQTQKGIKTVNEKEKSLSSLQQTRNRG